MAQIIDGRALARELDEKTKAAVDALVAAKCPRPGLAIVLVGHDPASEVYVRRKAMACERVGICSFEYRLPAETSQDALLALIARLNADRVVDGILCQVPLPEHIDTRAVLGAISPDKDVDGFHPVNVGRLSTGTGGIVPCTPLGVMMLLDSVIDDFVGLDAVVIGKSNIVGKPVAMLLLERECTVSVTHIYTENLPELAAKADIIVAAAGAPELVRGSWVKPGAVVIDVGITRILGADGKEKLVGDVKFDEVQHARAVTPVPGGVGPMTIACLLHNTVQAAKSNGDGMGHDLYHDAPDRSLVYGAIGNVALAKPAWGGAATPFARSHKNTRAKSIADGDWFSERAGIRWSFAPNMEI
jgi:methylenetetrahydrofolate dehydrogenase (NADP+)/methenyltetrahydrofolate cyclohydrolase